MYHSSRGRRRERGHVGPAEMLIILLLIAAVVGLVAYMVVEGAAPGGPVPWTAWG